ncbi:MAG TPA: C2H2-type zinc finger protein [Thermoplasmata archaeon]|nr:C2H2-type zinc finger protein [Thermoplasmata archaeon]
MAYTCDTCGATFSTEGELRNHSQMHSGGERPPSPAEYKCAACGGVFHSEADLSRHVASAHKM